MSAIFNAIGIGIYVILIIFVAIVIIIALLNWWNQYHKTVTDSIAQACGIEQTVLASLNATIVQEIKDERAREIAKEIMNGQKVSDCDWSNLLKYLDKDERKKLKIYDIVCDFSSCLNP